MNASRANTDEYRKQLAELAELMTTDKPSPDEKSEFEPETREQMRLFAEENIVKRFDKLENQLAFLADVLPDYEALLNRYVDEAKSLSYDTSITDGTRCLDWLESNLELSPEQRDYFRCQRTRHDIEQLARRNRLAHVRFQELLSVADDLGSELGENPDIRIHLDPIRLWSRFETKALLDEEAELPTDVLFYANGATISTAILEDWGRDLVLALDEIGPCTLDEWQARSPLTRDEMIEFTRDLAEMRLVAFS